MRKIDGNDLVGQKFAKLTVVEYLGYYKKDNNKQKCHYYRCKCDCGNENHITSRNVLLNDGLHNCGCESKGISIRNGMKMKKYNTYDLTGEYGIGWSTNTNKEFYFDLEDYDKIKEYTWYEAQDKQNENLSYLVDRHGVRMHRLITNTVDAGFHVKVDHSNHNTFDNRKSNLRITSNLNNCDNQTKHKNNTSGISGVSKDKNGYWIARIGYNNERIYLGYFKNFEDAVKARKEAEEKYFGEYSYDNSMKYQKAG